MKYNLSKIMLKAWKVYRKTKNISFAEALTELWKVVMRIVLHLQKAVRANVTFH